MAKAVLHILLYPLLLAALLLSCHGLERKVHIVYMGERPQGDFSVASTHHSMLARVLESTSTAKESLIYSYGKSFNGFAAKLTDEVAKFSEMEGVISVLPTHKLKLHTTRSWDFMGFTKGRLGTPIEGDVIIGLLDTARSLEPVTTIVKAPMKSLNSNPQGTPRVMEAILPQLLQGGR
ncbi:cucumisin-like isoform X1 [Fagus crenata]